MARLIGHVRARTLLRSAAIQGSWNYRTMLGGGFAFTLVPVLRKLYGGDREKLGRALARHAGFFNSHPYLASVALGAVARLEREGADPGVIERLKTALVGPLGTLGDRLIWARWRPLCALIALLVFRLGGTWWIAVLTFLALYNIAHVWLRLWGLEVGWREGLHVGRALLGSPLRRMPDRLTIPLAAAGGTLVLLVPANLAPSSGISTLPALAVGLSLGAFGLWRPVLAMRIAAGAVVVGAAVLVGLGMILE